MTTLYITHRNCDKHDMGVFHPEAPQRLGAIQNRLITAQIADFLQWQDAIPATREQLEATHDKDYVASIFNKAPERDHIELDPDTLMTPYTLNAALLAAGSVPQAIDQVMQGKVDNVFCAVRPPGHHAEYDRAMGFCLFNNVAVGARHAINQYGMKRVAIVDFDVHHGNGTEHIFRDESKILYASCYQHPFYPFSNPDQSEGNRIHVPLAAGVDSYGFRDAISEFLLPELVKFKPEFILISAGFDGHAMDPLAQWELTDEDYGWITDQLMDVADRCCQGRIVSVLEGGYDLDALGRAACRHIRSLMKL